ncbi:MAG: glycosyltransferase [Verrucomicrobia bacterium]|nr:MAG: glycosyltransferase [Verrucomicrobiota bacterium]
MTRPTKPLSAAAPMKVALLGIGNARWIAGVQYHHSLITGNSRLPADERAILRLYLEEDVHRSTDYATVRAMLDGIWSTDFFPDQPRPLLRKCRKVARIIVRQKRIPAWPRSDLRTLLIRHGNDVLFTANGIEAGVSLPQVCWIPDCQHWHHPENFSREELARRDAIYHRMITEAAAVIVSNHSSFADIVERYPDAHDRLHRLPFTMVLPPGWRQGDPASVVRRYHLPEKFLMFPAQFWRHKNHRTLFEAIGVARNRGLDDLALVLTGHPEDPRDPDHAPRLRRFLEENGLEDRVHILGLIPRADQVQLLRAAAAIVQPSLYEGWSALIEDCRSLGKTVLASDIEMHREQAYEHTVLFDPRSPEDLATRIVQLWPTLTPGPDQARESTATQAHDRRLADFARGFLSICAAARQHPR